LESRYLVFTEQKLDTACILRNDIVFAFLNFVECDFDFSELEQALSRRPANFLQKMRVAKERLRGNATPQQTCPAQPRVAFDDGGLQTQLARTNGRDVSPGTGSDNRNIKRRLFFQSLCLLFWLNAKNYALRIKH